MSANLAISPDEFRLFRDMIEKESGISMGDEKAYLVESRLLRMVIESGCNTFGEFYQKANSPIETTLRAKIVDAMTTNETLWFRDESPFISFKDHLLPEFVDQLKTGKKQRIRIWSAASSTGQEPYSLAMLIAEYFGSSFHSGVSKEQFEIFASDISPSALFLAQSARYDPVSMSRGMIPGMKEKYFEDQGRVCILKPEIKSMVKFQQFNLQNSFSGLGKFDLVLLRNVAIYFSTEFKTALFKKITGVLNPGGYLIIGASETLSAYSTDYAMREMGRGIVYQIK